MYLKIYLKYILTKLTSIFCFKFGFLSEVSKRAEPAGREVWRWIPGGAGDHGVRSLVCGSKGDKGPQLFDCSGWKGSSPEGPCQARAPKAPLRPGGRAGSPPRSPTRTWKWKTRAPGGSLTKNLPKVGLGWLCWCWWSLLSTSFNSPLLFPRTKQRWDPWQFQTLLFKCSKGLAKS